MKNNRFSQLLVQVHSSLWFVPAVVILASVLLALGLVEVDRHADDVLRRRWPRLFDVEAEGARSMLSAIASSMATVAGVAFSITMVALALASNQYTSRVMRNFMRDRANQLVLGVFMGVYLYCLVVMRTLSGQGAFVPAAAALGGLVLAVVASGAFIFFVHHISASIQASDMAQAITRETLHTIDQVFPEAQHAPPPDPVATDGWHGVPARDWGYVQTVDVQRLLACARSWDTALCMKRKAGDFVGHGEPLLLVATAQPPDDALVGELNGAYGIDAFRTIDQDPAFGIRQLADMSLKALSPGINDTTTAITCIEHMGVILSRCADRAMSPRHYLDGSRVRLVTAVPAFAELVGLAFGQILENAEGNTAVLLRVMDVIGNVALVSRRAQVLAPLRASLNVVAEVAERSAKSRTAGEALRRKVQEVQGTLNKPDAR